MEKRRITGLRFCIVVFAVLLFGSLLCADDVIIPPFRGADESTYQNWRFGNSSNPATPEIFTNPYGSPSCLITPGKFNAGWLNQIPGMGTKTGYWDLGSAGTMVFTIPNQESTKLKEIWVQVTYFNDIHTVPVVSIAGATKVSSQSVTVEQVPTGGEWIVDQSVWQIQPSSQFETVIVTSSAEWGAVVEDVVIDTTLLKSFSKIAEAKKLNDNQTITLTGPVVTRRFDDFFYLEDADRTAGIRVNCSSSSVPLEGTIPTVTGVLTTVNGERVLDHASVTPGADGVIPEPLAIGSTAARVGLSPQGLLVRVTGRVYVTSETSFSISDGGFEQLAVKLSGISVPDDGTFVSVTGALGADAAGPVLWVNATSPITTWQ